MDFFVTVWSVESDDADADAMLDELREVAQRHGFDLYQSGEPDLDLADALRELQAMVGRVAQAAAMTPTGKTKAAESVPRKAR